MAGNARSRELDIYRKRQVERDELNEMLRKNAEEWRRTELPKRREKILNRGFACREEILDNIISVEELQADPHEVWRPTCQWQYQSGWVRVEIEG